MSRPNGLDEKPFMPHENPFMTGTENPFMVSYRVSNESHC
jgi:hypothetical protein